MMNVAISASLAILLVVTALVLVLAAKSRQLLKIAMRFLSRKRRLTVLTVLSLVVGSSIITGSLAVGDSMRYSMVEGVYDNLGAVDEIVSSGGLFNESVLSSISADADLAGVTDAIAPLLVLKGSVRSVGTGLIESNVNVIGYERSLLSFGDFRTEGGGTFTGGLEAGEAIINQNLASRLGISYGDVMSITARNPQFSIESIYSPLVGQATTNVNVSMVVQDKELGRLNFEMSGKVPLNVFLDLDYLQSLIDAEQSMNRILVSNLGDEREGVVSTEEVTLRLEAALDEAVGYTEAGFRVEAFSYVRMESENIFFDTGYLDRVQALAETMPEIQAVSPLTSYFVNSISFGNISVPYSTVTGLDPIIDYAFGPFTENSTGSEIIGEMQDDEMIITNYTAARLGADIGDIVTLNYTIYTEAFTPIYRTSNFTVVNVVNIAGKAEDENLMPPFPGIAGTESCADWDPTWMDGDRMRSEMTWEDLYYWVAYGGTPKAYITLEKAQQLWANDLGGLTTIKVKSENASALLFDFRSRLNSTIDAGDAGIIVLPIKRQGIESAEGVHLLTETFLSFGAVAILAGILLVAGLVSVIIEDRRREIGTLAALGYHRSQITRVFAFEGFFLSAIASGIGILAGLAVAWVCILLTNTFWSSIVEGAAVSLHFTVDTLAVGYAVGFLLSFLTFALAAYWTSRISPARALKELDVSETLERSLRLPQALAVLGAVLTASYFLLPMDESTGSLAILAGPVFLALFSPFFISKTSARRLALHIGLASAIIITVFVNLHFVSASESTPFLLFFASGFILVLAFLVWLSANMRGLGSSLSGVLAGERSYPIISKMAFLSPSRRVRRTCLAISLFAVVIFTYLGLSVNISGQQANLEQIVEHQGAGYDVIAESSIPLRFDLGSPEERTRNNVTGFPEDATVVQFLTYGQPGGSCSNLRKNLPPRLIGANRSFIAESKLGFEIPKEGAATVWSKLDEVRSDGSIPAIGDYNTVVWILEKNVGDSILITDEYGDSRELVIVGITENSIFPGAVFVSDHNLDSLHPTNAEYDLFLFRTDDPSELVARLESSLIAYGMDARPVDDVVKENLSVEWSYMGLFQAFLLFGLLIGIFALAAFSSRSVEERRHEIGTMKSLGLERLTISGIFLVESLYIALLGSLVGILAGLLVSFTFFGESSAVGYGAAIPWVALLSVLAIVILASLVATYVPAKRAADLHPAEALKRDQ